MVKFRYDDSKDAPFLKGFNYLNQKEVDWYYRNYHNCIVFCVLAICFINFDRWLYQVIHRFRRNQHYKWG